MLTATLASLLDQPEATRFLRGVVASGRYGNAYLFDGPAGVGKGTAALAFARAVLCEHSPGAAPAEPSLFGGDAPTEATGPADDACGTCAGCTRTAALAHPDLKFLFPVSGEERRLDETISAIVQSLRDDPLYVFQYDKADSIRLSLTKELTRELAYRTYQGGRRVVVMRDADRMRADQYSALLKSLEEPDEHTVWVLTTSRLGRVPATIRSRCQRVRFVPLREATVAGFLNAQAGVAREAAAVLAAVAAGSLGRALQMRGEDVSGQRAAALALLDPAIQGAHAEVWKAAQGAAKFGKAGRDGLRRILELQVLFLRDLLRTRHGEPAGPLLQIPDTKEPDATAREKARRERLARLAQIERLAQQLDATEVRRRVAILEEAARAIDGNVSADLALFSAWSRVGGQPLGERGWPPHPTGRWRY